MIHVTIKPRDDGKYDIYVNAANGESLLNSSQGYDNLGDAAAIARKVFGRGVDGPMPSAENSDIEPIQLTIERRSDGHVSTERLR